MLYRGLGQSGIEASVVALGAWAIGGWKWGGTDESDAVEAIRAAIDHGVTLIDTAPIYGFGLSESIVGKAIAGRRDEVVLATKCGLVWNVDKGNFCFDSDGKSIYGYLGPESIHWEVEQSLQRLDTDYIDLYQTHWPESTTPIADTMEALLELKEEGKIRAIGASNVTRAQLAQYCAAGPLDSDQERYNMLDRDIEEDPLPYCRENGIAVLAYSPLAQGLLTGKVGPDREFSEGDQRRDNSRFSAENRRKVAAMLEELKPAAEARAMTLAQLAIAWAIAQPGLTHALVGARNPDQVRENAVAADVELTPDELAGIDEIIARHAAGMARH